LDFVDELGDDGEQVADDAVVGDLEDGRFRVLLIAMMVLEVCMPARCCIAPEIPTAMYSCGLTVLPVCPTWNWCGYQPAYA
jgi:hypothetical protein